MVDRPRPSCVLATEEVFIIHIAVLSEGFGKTRVSSASEECLGSVKVLPGKNWVRQRVVEEGFVEVGGGLGTR